MSGQPKKLRMEEGKADTATRSPPKKSRTTQTIPKKKKLKSEAEKAKEKAAKLRLGKVEITLEEVSRMTKAQKRELYAAAATRSAAHREVEQYEDDNVVHRHSMKERKPRRVPDITPEAAMPAGSKRKRSCRQVRKRRGQKRQQHRMKAKELPRQKGKLTGFHAGSSGRKFAKATMLQLSQAVRLRRRPAAAKQHPAVHRQPGLV